MNLIISNTIYLLYFIIQCLEKITKIELLLFIYLPRGPLFAIIKTKEAAFEIVSREGFKFLSRIFGIPEGII